MIELGSFALGLVLGLLKKAIESGVSYAGLSYFARRKIERRIEDATAEVVEPLLPFLTQEHVSDAKQRRLIQTCVEELQPLTEKPELLFQGSLNGQKIFEEIYAERELPQVIVEDGLKDIYTLLFPRIATLLGRIPAAVKDWESEAWSENFRRFDDLTSQMRTLFTKVDNLAAATSREADETLTTVRRALAQKVGFELDLTGLRADTPVAGKFDDFFVHPAITETRSKHSDKETITLRHANECFTVFTAARMRAVLIGAPGAGKSTWSKWLLRETVSARWIGLGVRVELRRFSGEMLPSFHELIRDAAGKHFAEELTPERIAQWVKARQIVLILDGFDEIRPSERESVLSWINELSAAARECPCIVTSRPLTTDHLDRLGTTWQEWTIEAFNKALIVNYIRRWYQFTPLIADANRDVDADRLANTWLEDPTIGPLTGNPLLLSTLLMVHHLDGSLPNGRSQLYKRYVEGMLGLWDDRRKVTATAADLALEQKRQILRNLALLLFLKQEEQIDESAALVWLRLLLQTMNVRLSPEDALATLRERTGLIVGPGVYAFAHKSIAEYLVAETILQGDQEDSQGHRIDRFRMFEHREDDRWNTVTFLWAGLAGIADVESLIDECLEVGTLDLAGGILFDQYERISKDIRRRLLLRMLSLNKDLNLLISNFAKSGSGSSWVVSQSANDQTRLNIPTFGLRQLTPDARLHDLLVKAALDGTLVWTDTEGSKGNLRDVLWMVFSMNSINLNQWKACLKTRTPKEGPSWKWLFWVMEYALVYHKPTETNFEQLMNAFIESCGALQGVLPIALVSGTAGMLLLKKRLKEKPPSPETIGALLKLLPEVDNGQVVPDLLLGTHEWFLGWGRTWEDHVGDLFPFFVNLMEEGVANGTIAPNLTYDRAIEFVNELKSRRDALSRGNA